MTEFQFKKDFLRRLVDAVPKVLSRQDPKTGRFGEGIWIVNDQHSMYPLAVAWSYESAENPYYHDPQLLTAVISAGDALVEDADETGQWEFRKKDGSTWGPIFMPWTYSVWLRSFSLVRDGMPADARKRWEDAFLLAFDGISKHELGQIHNIPTYHAAALYLAGKLFDRPEWSAQAQDFLARVVQSQDAGGFWSENHGPVVGYNMVYVDALGFYYAVSRDEAALSALEKAVRFHANFTYPDGSRVETIDERQVYHGGISFGNVGFSFTPEGRGYLMQQLALGSQDGKYPGPDMLASFLHHGEEGPAAPTAAAQSDHTFILGNDDALIRRAGPWFVCFSAYHCPIPERRWIQDRQNLMSIYHDRCGLILGGGNTKLQPRWSNFTVGDVSLLKHTPGDENPRFTPEGPIHHIPSSAKLITDPLGLELVYGGEDCSISLETVDDTTLRIHLMASSRSGEPVAAHLIFMPQMGEPVRTERMPERILGDDPFSLTSEEAGGWIALGGWRLAVPHGASIAWPVLPHNPYTKDGSATPHEGRLVVSMPFMPGTNEYVLTLSVD